jgi:hypothetical protein
VDAQTGASLRRLGTTSGSLLVDDARTLLYVNNGAGVDAVDLVTGLSVGTVDFGASDQPGPMVLSDDGTRLLALSFDGSHFHMHDIDPATRTETHADVFPGFPSGLFLIGNELVVWDDGADAVSVYSGTPLVENAAKRATFDADGAEAIGVIAVRDPVRDVIYIARALAPTLVVADPKTLPASSTIPMPDITRDLHVASNGSHITALVADAFVEVQLPGGVVGPSVLQRTAVPHEVQALLEVAVAP